MEVLTKEVIVSFKDAARKLTGPKRRAFEAQVALDYLDGNIWKAEEVFGWSHKTVELGLNELRTGITCMDNFSARGNRKTEAKFPELEADIRALAEPESQTDPKFQSPFRYTRMTAKAMRKALIDQKGWTDEELPHVNTIGEILNRLGIKLRPVQKTKPLKKIKETDAIFANVRQENQAADDDPDVIRISMDAKAKVAVGDFSRDGESRGAEATQAWDHDPEPEQKLVPQGILDLTSCLLSIFIATSNGTSIDCSPKGDAPGFVQLLDDRTLLIPDRPGNNRIDGMTNLLVNPKVGIIFMVPGSNETYRVTGSATISTDPELLKRFEVRGKPPRVVTVVAVDEAFNHCPKAFVRAKLWDATARPSGAPSHGDFAAARDGKNAAYARDYNEKYAERLKTELY